MKSLLVFTLLLISVLIRTLVAVIKDSQRLNLSVSRARGQCYDGASNMTGAKAGVAKQISDMEERAVFTHCYGHALNLACVDTMKASKILKDSFDISYEITKLVKFSSKREVLFETLTKELAPGNPGLRVLCPTRWTVRANSLNSIIVNYAVLQGMFEESVESTTNTDMKCRILGAIAQMKTFNFLFGIILGELILNHT